MRKSLKILIPLLVVLTIGVVVIGTLGYILFSKKTVNTEMIFPTTEVGTPVGDKVTKDIGPAGGTIASPGGRLTLTVPQNALTEAVAFSIQPITNKAGGGLGLAYRLEPSGKTFTTPLQISVRYDEHDLEGTIPEVLALAYQDQQREWHEVKSLNQTKDTLTVATTHFTDWSFLAKMRLEPATATLGVGKTLYIVLIGCANPELTRYERFNRWMDGPEKTAENEARERHCKFGTIGRAGFSWYVDVGTIGDDDNPVLYTAPPKKPTPNVATVVFPYYVGSDSNGWRKGMFTSHVTIVDHGYRASGNAGGDTVFSGDICDLEKHFTIKTNNPFLSSLEFVPSSPTKGTYSFSTTYGVTGGGGGKYTITGSDALWTGIELNSSSTATFPIGPTLHGSGPVHIDLVPLKDECKP
jgi:hypothetical protein